MKFASRVLLLASVVLALTAPATHAAPVFSEHVTGGQLDLVWIPGFFTPQRQLQPLTLDPGHPAYSNPSGDHTVAEAINTVPDSGGIIMAMLDPGAISDYSWETWMFTGDGNTRRGIVFRGDPSVGFTVAYQFVVESGLATVRLRKLSGQGATNLVTWFLPTTAPFNAPLPTNTWAHFKVNATGNQIRCWLNHVELTSTGPYVDATAPLLTGWAGLYNFRFDLGLVPVYFDDAILSVEDGPTPAAHATWGAIKARYR